MNIVREILKLLCALFVQVLFFNNLHFMGLCYPFVYVVALICMPVYDRRIEMLIGFAMGFVMDLFCSSLGMHTAACVLVSWLRPILLARLVQDYERITTSVSGASVGVSQFVRLAVLLCALHHAVVFLMDSWGAFSPLWLLLRWLLSTSLALLFVLAYGLTRKS